MGSTVLNWQEGRLAGRGTVQKHRETLAFRNLGKPEEGKHFSRSGPWGLERNFWLLVIQITNLNIGDTETDR